MGRRRKAEAVPVEFRAPTKDELYALFDVCEELDDACKSIMAEKKAKSKDMSERIDQFAKEHGCKPKDVRASFKYYLESKKNKNKNEIDGDSPVFTLMAIADEIASDEYKPTTSFKENLESTAVSGDVE